MTASGDATEEGEEEVASGKAGETEGSETVVQALNSHRESANTDTLRISNFALMGYQNRQKDAAFVPRKLGFNAKNDGGRPVLGKEGNRNPAVPGWQKAG